MKIPVIAHGGASKIDDIVEVFKKTEVSATAISSILHYNLLKNKNKLSLPTNKVGNLNFIMSEKKYKDFGNYNLVDIKKKLFKEKLFSRKI